MISRISIAITVELYVTQRRELFTNPNKEALGNFIKYELFRYINVRQKCEVLSKIFGVKANDVYALYEVKSFGIQVTDGYLTSGQRRLHHIFLR